MHLLFTIKAIKENISFLFLEKKQIMLKMFKKKVREKQKRGRARKKGKNGEKEQLHFFPD